MHRKSWYPGKVSISVFVVPLGWIVQVHKDYGITYQHQLPALFPDVTSNYPSFCLLPRFHRKAHKLLTMVPSHMQSVNSVSKGKAEIQTVPLPKIADDRVLVHVTAVGLNPTDWKYLEFMPVFGLRSGCNYAGVVEEVGPKVSKTFHKGDRITGATHGSNMSNLTDGAFAEYIAVKGDVQIKIPDTLRDEEAATLGVGISTVVSLPRRVAVG